MNSSISVGAVFRRTYASYAGNALVVLPFSTFAVVLVDLLRTHLTSGVPALIAGIVNLAATAAFVAVVVQIAAATHHGAPRTTISSVLRAPTPAIWQLMLALLVTSLALGLLLQLFGFVLILFAFAVVFSFNVSAWSLVVSAIGACVFVAPATFLLVMWSVTGPVVVLERPGRLRALGRSRRLVRYNGWRVFGASVLVVLPFAIAAGAIELAIHELGITPTSAATALIAILTAPITVILATELYFELRETADERTSTPIAPQPSPSLASPGHAPGSC
jgi:hypothetical protein